MKLDDILIWTKDQWVLYGDGTSVRVFGNDWRYFNLEDYVVASAISGPSLVLIPRVRMDGGT